MFILHITINGLHIHLAQDDNTGDSTPPPPDEHIAICEHCGWTKTYSDKKARNRGLSAHYGHCKGLQKPSDIEAMLKKTFERKL